MLPSGILVGSTVGSVVGAVVGAEVEGVVVGSVVADIEQPQAAKLIVSKMLNVRTKNFFITISSFFGFTHSITTMGVNTQEKGRECGRN